MYSQKFPLLSIFEDSSTHTHKISVSSEVSIFIHFLVNTDVSIQINFDTEIDDVLDILCKTVTIYTLIVR